MHDKIAVEIVRLIGEIAEDEKQILWWTKTAKEFNTDDVRQKYYDKAEMFKESAERKIRLIETLKKA